MHDNNEGRKGQGSRENLAGSAPSESDVEDKISPRGTSNIAPPIPPGPKDTPEEKGRVDLSRSMIQALAVATYLILLCTVRPYVHSKLRRWKLWVTAANQGTALLLLLARMLAEQAAAQPPAALASCVAIHDTKPP